MEIEFSPEFHKRYSKANVRIQNKTKEVLQLFKNNPKNPQLDNHRLEREWTGYRSININADWRAIYKEIIIEEETIAYFVAIGTHDKLYSKN